ncbi:MAG TPA: ABC transporter substrate-binding protein [Polyangia bacterium]|nr:ABC transporter substrate-binding protein [Polyangia bacterium]
MVCNGAAKALRRRDVLLGAAGIATAGLAGYACRSSKRERGSIVIGGLPVTCNLTLPIACTSRRLARERGQQSGELFEYSKYSGWPEVKESLMAGRIEAAFMLAPLVMDLATKNIPVKIVSLGHRSGAVIMVGKESPYRKFRDLTGKRVAIPSRFAVDYLFLRKMLKQEGMTTKDVVLIEMAPPDMPAALYAKAVDAYCTGEPFGAAAQKAGYAIPLRMTRDEWRNYICCVLTVREEVIATKRPAVQELVNTILGAGKWLDEQQPNREKAAEIAAGRQFFNQDPGIIKFVMENPTDRVTYGDLRMIKAEFDELMQLSVEAGTLPEAVPYARYADESFVAAASPAPIVVT